MKRIAVWFLAAGLFLPHPAAGAPSITHHVITADINPRRSFIEVTDGFHVKDLESSSFRFKLNRGLEITSLSQEGNALRWRRIGPAQDMEGAAVVVEVNLLGGNRKEADLRITCSGVIYDSLTPPDEPYARSFEQTTGLIDKRGAFLSGSTAWIPTVDGSLFRYRLLATVPGRWESVSQGRMEARTLSGASRVTRWVCDDPMEEVYLVAGPYVFEEANHGDIKIYGFLYDADDREDLWRTYLERTSVYLDLYSTVIGPYPFPKFAVVENFWQTGFGMPSFTLLGDKVIRLPFIPYTSYRHEILHNWWGNGVYVDWKSGNWCEGLTSYGADHANKEERSAADAVSYRRGELRKYRNYVQEAEDFPLSRFTSRSSSSTQAVGYSKATMVFHMLRISVGDVSFHKALQRFFKERKFLVSGWNDLRTAFEEETLKDLGVFFDQWVNRKGAPVLSVADVKTKKEGDRYEVETVLHQEKPYYQLEVPVRLETDLGAEETFVILDGPGADYRWKGAGRPLSLSIDPDFDLFRKLYRAEIPPALSQTLGADSTLIVLGDSSREDEDRPLAALAAQWAEGGGAEVVHGEVEDPLFRRRTVWLLGETAYGGRFVETLPAGVSVNGTVWTLGGKEYDSASLSLVITAPHPENGELSWTLFLPASDDAVPAIGRKIPHYGKYGYLVFDGDRNVAKGEWPSGESPMRIGLDR